VPVGSIITFSRAMGLVGLESPSTVYWAGRTVLVRRQEDIALYDRVFTEFWRRAGADPAPTDRGAGGDEDLRAGPSDAVELAPDFVEGIQLVRYSAREQLRHKDFAAATPEELDEIVRLLSGVRHRALRRSRRLRPHGHRHGRSDPNATVRRALRTGGEVVRIERRAPTVRPRRVVLLCDVSGSMEPYSRMLLRFAHLLVVDGGPVEAFALGTRLTRLTRELSCRDEDIALARVGARVEDWSGGTRLGEGLGAFNDRFGMPGMARGATVVVLSDGWDRGDTERLSAEMERLHRAAHLLVWVNPLKGSAGYQPLARGMAAALPHVDRFVEGHCAASLEELVEVVSV
jgi:uncharacterized protein